jgi:hypothetical protein
MSHFSSAPRSWWFLPFPVALTLYVDTWRQQKPVPRRVSYADCQSMLLFGLVQGKVGDSYYTAAVYRAASGASARAGGGGAGTSSSASCNTSTAANVEANRMEAQNWGKTQVNVTVASSLACVKLLSNS